MNQLGLVQPVVGFGQRVVIVTCCPVFRTNDFLEDGSQIERFQSEKVDSQEIRLSWYCVRQAAPRWLFVWCKYFGQMNPADVKRPKALELENSRMKNLLAAAALDILVRKDINSKKW